MYRAGQGDPDRDARECLALERYGRWSLQRRSAVLLAFGLLGTVAGLATVVLLVWATGVMTRGYVLPAVGVGAAFLEVGRRVGRRLVRGRAPEVVARLARDHEVDPARLTETVDMANSL